MLIVWLFSFFNLNCLFVYCNEWFDKKRLNVFWFWANILVPSRMSAQKHFSQKPDLTCSKFCRLQYEEFLGDHCGFVELFLSRKNNSSSYDLVVRVLDNQSQGSGFKAITWFYGGLSLSLIRWRSNGQYVLNGNFSCFLKVVLAFGQDLI